MAPLITQTWKRIATLNYKDYSCQVHYIFKIIEENSFRSTFFFRKNSFRFIVKLRRRHRDSLYILTQYMHSSVQFSSVAQSCPTLCNPMNCSMLGLPVHHQLPESTQTQVHQVDDAIQPSHPPLSPSPPALNLSQQPRSFPMRQLYTSGSLSTRLSASTSVLPVNTQD